MNAISEKAAAIVVGVRKCGATKNDGGVCRLGSYGGDPEGRCIFHSKTEAARALVQAGRVKGASAKEYHPDRLVTKKRMRALGLRVICTSGGLLRWLNLLNQHFIDGKLTGSDLDSLLKVAGGISTVLANKEVAEELTTLKQRLDDLDSSDIVEDLKKGRVLKADFGKPFEDDEDGKDDDEEGDDSGEEGGK